MFPNNKLKYMRLHLNLSTASFKYVYATVYVFQVYNI